MTLMLDILAAVTPMDRFYAVRTLGDGPAGPPSLWLIAVYVGAAAAVAAVLIVVYRRWFSGRRAATSVRALGRELGLTPSERAILTRIARLAGAPNAAAVLSRESLFNAGTAALMCNEPVISMAPQSRARIGAAVTALRRKLGFISQMDVKARTEVASVPFAEGASVEVTVQNDPATYAAVVRRTDGPDLTLETQETVACRNDDFCRIRYGSEGTLWECDAFVMAGGPSRLLVRLAGAVRTLDLRKYTRVKADGEASVAEFPVVKDGRAPDAPAFVPARVTETGGPGLRLDSPLRVAEGERILVVLKLGERSIQGVGRVRRVSPREDGVYVTAVEMIGLTEAELKEFLRETALAAQKQDVTPAAEAEVATAGAKTRFVPLS